MRDGDVSHFSSPAVLQRRVVSGRFFWKTMRRDVMQWINSCSQCNKKKMNKPGMQMNPRGSESLLRSPQRQDDDSDR